MAKKRRIIWSSLITVDDVTMTIEDWLRRVYLDMTDEEIASVLTDSGFPAVAEKVRAKRRRIGLGKIAGAVALSEPVALKSPGWEGLTELEKMFLISIKNKPKSLRALSGEFDRSEDSIAAMLAKLGGMGYNVIQTQEKMAYLDTKTIAAPEPPQTLLHKPSSYLKFALLSDIHAGSKFAQTSFAHSFIRYAYGLGVRHILIPGDSFDGREVYRGHIHEVFALTDWEQRHALDYTLLKLDGLEYYLLGGNHDFSFIRRGDPNSLAIFCEGRSDCHYLGYGMADVPFTAKIDIRLWHPRGGVPYSDSYRIQKGSERTAFEELARAIDAGEAPHVKIMAAGHLHSVSLVTRKGPALGIQCGCAVGQTSLQKERALVPQLGGYVVELWITDRGQVQRDRIEWVSGHEAINDYLNHPGLQPLPAKPEHVATLFQWDAITPS